MYNSDTVYSTTTFRPVSPLAPPSPRLESPQRTRKLETPLHFDGGLFSDIRSKDGKLLSKVTVDRMHCSSRRDVTDSPSVYETVSAHGKDYVDDVVKTETITNEEVIKVKFTPVPFEVNSPRLLTPSQFERPQTPVPYIKNGFEDLQSYKIVNSICKDKQFQSNNLSSLDANDMETIRKSASPLAGCFNSESIKQSPSPLAGFLASESMKPLNPLPVFLTTEQVNRSPSPLANFLMSETIKRPPSPLANLLVSEQLTKIDHYLQESLDVCGTPPNKETREEVEESNYKLHENLESSSVHSTSDYRKEVMNANVAPQSVTEAVDEFKKSKVNSVKVKNPGVLGAIYNMPVHYHAIILCFFLIVYNLIYQYVKENCHGKK